MAKKNKWERKHQEGLSEELWQHGPFLFYTWCFGGLVAVYSRDGGAFLVILGGALFYFFGRFWLKDLRKDLQRQGHVEAQLQGSLAQGELRAQELGVLRGAVGKFLAALADSELSPSTRQDLSDLAGLDELKQAYREPSH